MIFNQSLISKLNEVTLVKVKFDVNSTCSPLRDGRACRILDNHNVFSSQVLVPSKSCTYE